MESVSTSDFYEATWYLLNNCTVRTIQCLPVNGKVGCTLTFEGEKLPSLQIDYFQGRAEVNLLQFRRAYGQVKLLRLRSKEEVETGAETEGGRGR